jgi:hypothetical protein
MPYRIAGIDVHKKKLAVVVADVEVEDEYQFERRWYGSNPESLATVLLGAFGRGVARFLVTANGVVLAILWYFLGLANSP